MNTDTMTRDQKSLLLYLETLAVDYSGRIEDARMNDDDWANLERWKEEGFIETGRIRFKDVQDRKTKWVHLTSQAYDLAHQLRRERAERAWANRNYQTTEEARA
jgi:hypothetical protein